MVEILTVVSIRKRIDVRHLILLHHEQSYQAESGGYPCERKAVKQKLQSRPDNDREREHIDIEKSPRALFSFIAPGKDHARQAEVQYDRIVKIAERFAVIYVVFGDGERDRRQQVQIGYRQHYDADNDLGLVFLRYPAQIAVEPEVHEHQHTERKKQIYGVQIGVGGIVEQYRPRERPSVQPV